MRLLLSLLLPCSLWAQVLPGRPDPFAPYVMLRDYLSLTLTQQAAILANLAEQARTDAQRNVRMQQLRNEIAIETAAEAPDSHAIGTREVEIELICRVIDSEAKALSDRNLALLTDAQKAKLKLLDDAMRLAPTISSAQQLKLLPTAVPPAFTRILTATVYDPLLPGPMFNPAVTYTYSPNSCAAAALRR